MAAQFQFVMRSGPSTGTTYPLDSAEIIIGRDASNGVAINDAEVSRKHAKLTMQESGYVIQDLGSTNGTFINGQRITGSQGLKAGDVVTLGENIVLMYESIFDPNATVISSIQSLKTAAPIRKPTPAPVPTPPPSTAPVDVFPVQVPASPVQKTVTSNKKKFPIWLIIVIVFLLIICACVGFFVIIDQLNLWCKVIPFLVPLIGGTCA